MIHIVPWLEIFFSCQDLRRLLFVGLGLSCVLVDWSLLQQHTTHKRTRTNGGTQTTDGGTQTVLLVLCWLRHHEIDVACHLQRTVLTQTRTRLIPPGRVTACSLQKNQVVGLRVMVSCTRVLSQTPCSRLRLPLQMRAKELQASHLLPCPPIPRLQILPPPPAHHRRHDTTS